MKQKTKRRIKLLSFKSAGVVASVALPAWAILEKFPIWKVETGTAKTLGIGGIMIAIVALVTFKRSILNYIKEKTGMKTAPPLAIWAVLLIASFALTAVANILADMRVIFIAGLAGSGIGTVLNFIGETLGESEDSEREERNEQNREGTADNR